MHMRTYPCQHFLTIDFLLVQQHTRQPGDVAAVSHGNESPGNLLSEANGNAQPVRRAYQLPYGVGGVID
jgi:hypothetical protein